MRRPASGRESIFYRGPLHHATTAGRSFQCSCRASRRSVYRDDTDDKSGRASCSPGVMHPAEVPLVPEAQTAHILRTRNAGKSVDSSAIVTAPETCSPRIRLVLRKNSIASRFSRPPNSFGIHSPLYGCSRDKSLTPPHRRAAHQYQNVQSSKVRYRQGSY